MLKSIAILNSRGERHDALRPGHLVRYGVTTYLEVVTQPPRRVRVKIAGQDVPPTGGRFYFPDPVEGEAPAENVAVVVEELDARDNVADTKSLKVPVVDPPAVVEQEQPAAPAVTPPADTAAPTKASKTKS